MVMDDSGSALALLLALVAGIVLAGLGSLAMVASVAATPDTVKPALVTYDES